MAEQVNIIDSVNSFDMSSDDEDDSFLNAIRKGECSPIPIEEIFEVQSLLLNAEYLK